MPGSAVDTRHRPLRCSRSLCAKPLFRAIVAASAVVLRSDATGLRGIWQRRNQSAGSGFLGRSFTDVKLGAASFLGGGRDSAEQYGEMMVTAAPTLAPGPYPQVVWVQQFPPAPLLTTPPLPEQCYGCHCLIVQPNEFLDGGNIANKYTCVGGRATHRVPGISWFGQPGQDKRGKNGKPCPECAFYAVTVEDLDYPDGVGETSNSVRTIFWAVNIPSDWTELNEVNAFQLDETGRPIVVVGKNELGRVGLETPCPRKGTHRYRTTLWAVDRHIGNDVNPLSNSVSAAEVHGMLVDRELARASFFANAIGPGGM